MTELSFYITLGIVSASIVCIWGIFLVIRLHSMKFKNFNSNIPFVLRGVLILLIILTCVAYILVFVNYYSSGTSKKAHVEDRNDIMVDEKSY